MILHCEHCPLRVYGFCSHFLFILDNGSRDKVTGCNWIDRSVNRRMFDNQRTFSQIMILGIKP